MRLSQNFSIALIFLLSSSVTQADPVPPVGTCEVEPVFTPSFDPEIEWEWTSSSVMPNHVQVMMTPIVIELNGDGVPDVVFNSFSGGNYTTNGVIRAISGADGSELWSVADPTLRVRGEASIAAGDLDGDGLAEVCTAAENNADQLCFENDGSFKMRFASSATRWGGLSFADLGGDGTVEILSGNRVHDASGALLWSGSDGIGGPGLGPISFAADINQDNDLEVINDRAIYNPDGTLLCVNTSIGHGLAGVANFDGDSFGEVAVVWSGNVSLLDHDCTLLWTTAIPGAGRGGAPNIADFDGDGEVEIGVAGRANYVVFETNGSVRWSQPVQDFSSNVTGSSTFDFEGDGAAEVVYADEHRLRIYDGATGAVRFDVPHSSGTTYENPVIADVDGDGNAEIIIASNNYAFAGVAGIRVFRDANDGWVNTRGIWNQHAYSVTNVNDDGTIPALPATNWLDPSLNTFRSNSQGTGTVTPFAAPDLIVTEVSAQCVDGSFNVRLGAHIHNQGDAPASAGVNVAFYLGDPDAGGTLLHVETIGAVIPALGSTSVDFEMLSPGGTEAIYAVVDDDGTGNGSETECIEDNNTASATFDLNCTPNDPPVAMCADRVLSANNQCLANASIDNGSFDPDNDPISLLQTPPGPYGLGSTTVVLEVCDDSNACDSCSAQVSVVDDTPPVLQCNQTDTITPADAPISFTASTSDNCSASVVIDSFDCFKIKKDGTAQSKLESCIVSLNGDSITIEDSGGVGTHITWLATATDDAGNTTTEQCQTQVENPGQAQQCNQGLGNGEEGCDPGNSNQGDPGNSNDENGGSPGHPGKKAK